MKTSLEELEKRIAELRARLPRHSVPAVMLIELEDLEEELARLLAQQQVQRQQGAAD